MKELIESIVKVLVDRPDQVKVGEIDSERNTIFELRVAPSDLGKVIGRQGRTVQAIRILVAAAGMKLRKRCDFEIVEMGSENPSSRTTVSN